jgi:hypothetical protein
MTPRALLVTLSAAQLAAEVAGLVVAVRRRRAYDMWTPARLDVPLWHGAPEHVARDALWMGTAYSAPTPMLLAQAWAIATLARRPDDGARRVLGLLGVLMVPGHLVERSGRAHLRHPDPVETPVVAAGTALAAAMAVLGHRAASAG